MQELKAQLSRRDRRILKLRTLKCMTQRDIARRVGISQQHVSRVLARVKRLADSFLASLSRQTA